MPILRKCCHFFSLRTGGVILGWLATMWYFITAVLYTYSIFYSDLLIKLVREYADVADYKNDTIGMTVTIFLSCYVAFLGICVITSSLLTAGAVRGNRCLIVPWLITCGINLVFGVFISIFQFYMSKHGGFGFLSFFLLALLYGFEMYLWLAVFSLYQQMREEKTRIGVTNSSALISKDSRPST